MGSVRLISSSGSGSNGNRERTTEAYTRGTGPNKGGGLLGEPYWNRSGARVVAVMIVLLRGLLHLAAGLVVDSKRSDDGRGC